MPEMRTPTRGRATTAHWHTAQQYAHELRIRLPCKSGLPLITAALRILPGRSYTG